MRRRCYGMTLGVWMAVLAMVPMGCGDDDGGGGNNNTNGGLCGDGVVLGDETCDGTDFQGKTCDFFYPGYRGTLVCSTDCATINTTGCAAPRCGDGTVDANEVCDDGNQLNGDGCNETCSSDESCGNGILDQGEECDCGTDANNLPFGCIVVNSDVTPGACRTTCLGTVILPVDGRFHVDCPFVNLGALRTPKPDIVMDCAVSAQTTSGDVVPTTSLTLYFLAEAGVLTTVDDPLSGERVIRYSVRGGNAQPVDVAPVTGEPTRTGSLGEERNPRDGVVTLLAIVRGSEAWIDLNSNGVRDAAEPFTDLAEPFLDVDDDGAYTPGIDEYFDSNGDGSWTVANGSYDADTFIGAVTKVIWSGPNEEATDAARIETVPTTLDIPDGGSLIMRVFLLDRNMNPVAAFSANNDELQIVEQFGYVNVSPNNLILQNTIGMAFDTGHPQWPILQFFTDAGKLADITLHDASPNSEPPETNNFSVSISALVSPGPDVDGYYLTQETDLFIQSIQGTVH